jgi:hypothetical protein
MRAGSDLMEFMKYSDVKPWKAMLGPFMQVKSLLLFFKFSHHKISLDAFLYLIFSWYSWFS